MPKGNLTLHELTGMLNLDAEVIDLENHDGKIIPVVKAYDDEKVHLHFWCIHCRKWHVHGRGGPDAPYEEGRGGYAGHRTAHCTADNSPFRVNGVILHVVGKFDDSIREKHRKGTPLHCPKCRREYSAALNACNCKAKFINKRRASSHPKMAKNYQERIR